MTSVTFDDKFDPIQKTTSNTIVWLKDAVTGKNIIGDVQYEIRPTTFTVITKSDSLCILSPFHLPDESLAEDNFTIKISLKNYVGLEIKKEDNTYSDYHGLLKNETNTTLSLGNDTISISNTKFIPSKDESLKLHPSSSYVFPTWVYALHGTIDTSNDIANEEIFYRISSSSLEQTTIAEKNGQFVLFIHDELVNYLTIINNDKTGFDFNMKIEKISKTMPSNTTVFDNEVHVSNRFKSINLGKFGGSQ